MHGEPAGFLSTGDSNAPGNYALLDQVAALRWVQENIRAFGGNPNEVTIMGHGYGGVMVNLLLISPVTKGTRFRRCSLDIGLPIVYKSADLARYHLVLNLPKLKD